VEKSYKSFGKAGLTDSMEALILAAQEQALSTRATEAVVYHTRYRMCKEAKKQSSTARYGQVWNTWEVIKKY